MKNTCSKKENSNSETASRKSVNESSLDSTTKDVRAIKYKMLKPKKDAWHIFDLFIHTFKFFLKKTLKALASNMDSNGDSCHSLVKMMILSEVRCFSTQINYKSNLTKMNFKKMDPWQPFWCVTESEVQDDNNRSGNDTDADDTDIRPVYNEEPMVEVQLTVECNILAIGQHHTKQPEIINEGRVKNYPEQCQVKSPMLDSSPDNQTTDYSKQSLDLGEPILQSLRKQSVVRQPNAFKSERPQMSKPRFASQVDVNKNLSKPVTQHYFPKKRKSGFAKPDHMIASSESRNSSKNMPRFSSNDMVHNHYLDEARKKTHTRDRNSKTSVMPSARFQSAADGKLFDSYTSKDDSEPTHGSNVDIPNIHESKQTLDLSACTSINVQKEQGFDLSTSTSNNVKPDNLRPRNTMSIEVPSTDTIVMTSMIELESLFGPFFDEYFNGENQVVLKSFTVTIADAFDKRQQQPDSTSSTSALATTVTADENFDL
nr:hypothetical protein [Tanacetum cinerariifolium]